MTLHNSINQSFVSSNSENIKILNRVRLIAIIGQAVVIAIAVLYLKINLPLLWLSTLIILEIVFEIYSLKIIQSEREISSAELFVHIVVDSLILAGLIYFSGGANNPFIYLLLLSVALSSFMLSPFYLFTITILQLSLYSLLHLFQSPVELYESSPLASFHLHLAGMWANFILTAILIAVFGLLTRFAMIKQEKILQGLREKNLQDEQILGLGIMAANAAHELATPLSTMAIVVEDLQHSNSNENSEEDMQLLSSQISNCKKIIAVLSERSASAQQQLLKESSPVERSTLNFTDRLGEIANALLVYRPQIKVSLENHENIKNINQSIPLSVEQAITNILDNACDASLENKRDRISVSSYLSEDALLAELIIIDIKDFGSGISADLKKSFGDKIQQTTKKDGLGWGMFLSNVSIERVGGHVQILDDVENGTTTRISLPLLKNL